MRDVYGCILTFEGEPLDSYDLAVSKISSWIGGHYQEPEALDQRDSGTWSPRTGERVEWEGLHHAGSKNRLWTLRWRRPHEHDEGVFWHHEFRVSSGAERCRAGFRVAIDSTMFRMSPLRFDLRTPEIIPILLDTIPTVADGREIRVGLETFHEADVPRLTAFLADQTRNLPAVVISTRSDSAATFVEGRELAAHLAGLSHVVKLADAKAGWALSRELGKPLSVYDGAVRIYWPGFSTRSRPQAHPLFRPEDIARTKSFPEDLLRKIAPVAALRMPITLVGSEFKLAVAQEQKRKRREAKARLREAGADKAWLDELESSWDEIERLERERDDLARQVEALTEQIGTASQALSGAAPAPPSGIEEPAGPRTVLDAVEQALQGCSHLVFLEEEVRESARSSPYQQPGRILAALLELDRVAARYAAGQLPGGLRPAFDEAGLDFKPNVSPTALGRFAQSYRRRYQGRIVSLGPHLCFGAGTPKTCARIYFYVDEEERKFVVGHVGNHLRDTTTG